MWGYPGVRRRLSHAASWKFMPDINRITFGRSYSHGSRLFSILLLHIVKRLSIVITPYFKGECTRTTSLFEV